MYISRDVVYHESSFPFSSHSLASTLVLQPSSTLLPSSLSLPPHLVSSPPAASNYTTPIPSPSSASGSANSSSNSSSAFSSPISQSLNPCPAPTRIHPMVTRAQNQIVLPRVFTDGRIKYPLPRALLVVTNPAIEEKPVIQMLSNYQSGDKLCRLSLMLYFRTTLGL
jgi:hypothetical protein